MIVIVSGLCVIVGGFMYRCDMRVFVAGGVVGGSSGRA